MFNVQVNKNIFMDFQSRVTAAQFEASFSTEGRCVQMSRTNSHPADDLTLNGFYHWN